jgi:leucyl/phenylalanyl-tRNA--protein transferase
MSIVLLDKNDIFFPDPRYNDDDDAPIAIGGDLSVDRLLLSYSNGIFPWYDSGDPIMWWCPLKRFIIKPGEIHISHSMKKFFRKHKVKVVLNRNFRETMHKCRMARELSGEGTWINDDMEEAYYELHRNGFAVSAEAMVDGRIAGGLYGVSLGKCFFGESMYSDEPNGSKAALIGLANILEKQGFLIIDCQFHTDHLETMGGVHISYDEYMNFIRRGMEKKED